MDRNFLDYRPSQIDDVYDSDSSDREFESEDDLETTPTPASVRKAKYNSNNSTSCNSRSLCGDMLWSPKIKTMNPSNNLASCSPSVFRRDFYSVHLAQCMKCQHRLSQQASTCGSIFGNNQSRHVYNESPLNSQRITNVKTPTVNNTVGRDGTPMNWSPIAHIIPMQTGTPIRTIMKAQHRNGKNDENTPVKLNMIGSVNVKESPRVESLMKMFDAKLTLMTPRQR